MTETIKIELKKQNLFIVAIIVLFVVLTLPTLFRFYSGNDSLIGTESYYHYRAARNLAQKETQDFFNPSAEIQDTAYYPRSYFFNPYHYLLVLASKVISLVTASRVLPFIFGILTVLIFNQILKEFIEEKHKRHIILILLIINPAFIYTYTVSNPHSSAIFFTLLGIYFFTRKGKHNFIFSVLLFLIVSLFSLFNTITALLLLLAYIITKKKMQNRFLLIVFLLAILSLTQKTGAYYNYNYLPDLSVISNIFSELGGMTGFGIFSIILAVYAIISCWKEKAGFIYFLLLAVLLAATIFFTGNMSNSYLMFFIAIAGGIGFIKLYALEWHAPTLKNFAILILLCGLLFSTTAYMTRLVSLEPDQNTIESLDWLSKNTFKDSFVLSHYSNGHLISTIARNPVLTDSVLTSSYDQNFLYKVQDSIFHSRKLEDAKKLLEAYNIRYIYITPQMKTGQVWSKPNEELLFLLTSKSTFEQVYDKEGTEIWKVINTTGVENAAH
jgi:hypothetical protein